VLKILSVSGRDFIANPTVVKEKLANWLENFLKSEELLTKQIIGLQNQTIEFNSEINDKMTIINILNDDNSKKVVEKEKEKEKSK